MSTATQSSRFTGYGREEMEAARAITRREDPRWSWLFPVTRTSRDFVTSNLLLLNGSYALSVGLIWLASRAEGVVSASSMRWWLLESAASIVTRNLLYVPVVRARPSDVARSRALRLLPLAAVLLGVAHWAWTAWLFVGPRLSTTSVVVLLVFVMLSIASIAIAPASPASCFIYLTVLWSAIFWRLIQSDWLGTGTLDVLLTALLGILGLVYRIVVSGSRRFILQSDETELLVQSLKETNTEVERLRECAADQLKTRSSFFASASHDFRQRVHALKLLAMPGNASAGETDIRVAMARIGEVAEELEDYMTNVLEFARLDGQALVPELREMPLQESFQRLELRFENVAEERGVELHVRPTQLRVVTDAGMLERVLDNVVSNAIKYTRDRVLVAARRTKDGVAIEVRDRGPGIPEDALSFIFEAFYQAGGTSTEPKRGVGLGLAIVKRLADSLGYRVVVQSWLGRGTVVRVLLPVRATSGA